tara:strand:+ start:1421 stop:2647 length:1227 start_codon:yes stop_codon:yes gene_type:complete
MSMTDSIKKVVAESVENESVTEEEISEVADEVVEEEVEVTSEAESDESLDEMKNGHDKKKLKAGYHKEEEEEDDEEEEVDEQSEEDDEDDDDDEVEEIAIPKTKAGVINAALEMLKKAKKNEAQQLFAKMVKMSESEDEGGMVAKASGITKKVSEPKAKVNAQKKMEDVDWSEDLDILVAEEATLSDGFRDKAGAIFEAAYKSKVSAEIDRLESEYAQNLESEVTDLNESLVNKVDSYLNYVVENWVKENEVAIEQGLRTEIAEQFMDSLQSVFKEHYIEVPEGKADLIDDLADQVAELEEQLNKTTEDNIQLHEKAQSFERADVVRRQSSGLAATEAEKLASLVEDIDFDDAETFEMKVKTVKESYFEKEISESIDEADALVGEEEAPVANSDVMNAYTQAISKHIK